jgi:hypothetical protein
MARPPTPLDPDSVRVTFEDTTVIGTGTPEEGGGPLDGGLWVANRFSATVDDPAMPYLVTLTLGAHDRRLATESITLTMRTGGAPITATSLRALKVDAYVARIRAELSTLQGGLRLMRRTDGEGTTAWSGVPEHDWPRFETSQSRRRRPEDTLPEVARAYREALGHQDSYIAAAPTQYVADELHYSRGHAARLVVKARKAGLLDPAPGPGRAGELAPNEKGTT